MGSTTVMHSINTEASLQDIRDATKKSLLFLGGTLSEYGEGFQLKGGNNGVNFAFTADIDALVNIKENSPSKFDIIATINWKPNGAFWACLIIGFFVFGILWIIPFLYIFVDPSQAYQQMLFRIQSLVN